MTIPFILCLATLFLLAAIGMPIAHATIVGSIVYLAVKGQDLGIANYGLYAVNTMRMEKGYKAWGSELTNELTMIEAEMDRFIRFDKDDFTGKQATLDAPDRYTDFYQAIEQSWSASGGRLEDAATVLQGRRRQVVQQLRMLGEELGIAREIIRDIGRVLALPLNECDKLAKMVPETPGAN